jgi:hypothetical protein
MKPGKGQSGASEVLRRDIAETLRRASDNQLSRVLDFIDRLPSRKSLDDLVANVRHRLAAIRPSRPMTLARLLTVPIEDLLTEPSEAANAEWGMPRDLLRRVQELVLDHLPDDMAARLLRAMVDRRMDDRVAVQDLGAELWPVAGDILAGCLNERQQWGSISWMSEEVRPRLVGLPDLFANASELMSLLSELPPKPMGTLDEAHVLTALFFLERARHVSEALLRVAFAILVRRSAEPSGIFRLLAENNFGMAEADRARILTEGVKECLRDVTSTALAVGRLEGRSVVAAADETLRLASVIKSLENPPAGVRIDNRQLSAAKAKAADSVVKTYQASLQKETHGFVNAMAGGKAEDDEVANAEVVARSTRKVEIAGGHLGIGDMLTDIARRERERYRELLARRLKLAPPGTDPVASVIDELRLLEIIFGPEDALKLLEDASRG